MRTYRQLKRALAAVGLILIFGGSLATGASTTIMPLGDSITWGDAWSWSGGHWGQGTGTKAPIPGGYRQRLYDRLSGAGIQFQFVGSGTDNSTPALTAAGQAANEGHNGYFTGNINDNLEGSGGGDAGHWLTGLGNRPAVYPDITILMIGTNDILNNSNPGYDLVWGLDPVIAHLFALRPATHLFLCTLLPTPDLPGPDAAIRSFNDYLANGYALYNNWPSEIAKYTSQGHLITLVDTFTPFANADGSDNTALFADGIHPNQQGYDLLGDTIADALLANPVFVPEPSGCAVLVAGVIVCRQRRSSRRPSTAPAPA